MQSTNEGDWKLHIKDDQKIIELLIRELYGDDPMVSLREVLQNAHDACIALKKAGDATTGVIVEIGVDAGGQYISVTDTGIGMTERDLREHLLAIGESEKSDWTATGDANELRRIVSRNTETIGKYGIGFLASFILAETVVVRTRHHKATAEEGLELRCQLSRMQPPKRVTLEKIGTEIRLYIRKRKDNDAFTRRAEALLKPTELQAHVTRLMFFSRVPIRLRTAQGDLLVSMPHLSPADVELDDLRDKLFGSMAAKAVASRCITLPLREGATDSHVFIFLWPLASTTEVVGQLHVWVRGMLVEERAQGVLPSWAFPFTAVVESTDLPVELDRRGISRTSIEFARLQKGLAQACIDLMKSTIEKDFKNFHREVWPGMRGVVLPQALRDCTRDSAGSEFNTQCARSFIREIAPLLPIRAFRYRPDIGGHYPENVNLKRLAEEQKAYGKLPPCKIPYVTVVGTINSTLNPKALGTDTVIDAEVKKDGERVHEDGTQVQALLMLVKELLPDAYDFNVVTPDVATDMTPEEMERGWGHLREFVERNARYSGALGTETYQVTVRRFKPAYLSAVAMEYTANTEKMKALMDHMKDLLTKFPEFKAMFNEQLGSGDGNRRTFALVLNADNRVMQEIVEAFVTDTNLLKDPRLGHLIRQQIEDARVDLYGGALIGSAAQADIYTNVREHLYLAMLNLLREESDSTRRINVGNIPATPVPMAPGLVMAIEIAGRRPLPERLPAAVAGPEMQKLARAVREWVEAHKGIFIGLYGTGLRAAWTDSAPFQKDFWDRSLKRLLDRLDDWLGELGGVLHHTTGDDELRHRTALVRGELQFSRFERAGSVVGRAAWLAERLVNEDELWKSDALQRKVLADRTLVEEAWRCNLEWSKRHEVTSAAWQKTTLSIMGYPSPYWWS